MNEAAMYVWASVCILLVVAGPVAAVWYYLRRLNSIALGWRAQQRILPVQARQLPHFPQWASQRGFRYAARDDRWVFLAHQLMLSGPEPQAEHVFHGSISGREAAAFQYSQRLAGEEQKGPVGDKRRSRYTIIAVRLPAVVPRLMISPPIALDQLPSRLGFSPVGIQFEQHHFNERFIIRAEDERFASAALAPQLMEWMMTRSVFSEQHVVVHGDWLITSVREPIVLDRLDEWLGALDGFIGRVPEHVWGTGWSVLKPR